MAGLPEAVVRHHGRVQLLINKAGVGLDGRFYEVSLDDVEALQAAFDKFPATSPGRAAARIVKAIRRNRASVRIGAETYILDWLHRISPKGAGRVLEWLNGADFTP